MIEGQQEDQGWLEGSREGKSNGKSSQRENEDPGGSLAFTQRLGTTESILTEQ